MTDPVIHVAAAVILDADGRMLVVRKRGTSAFMQPGGKIMPGESAVDAVRREVAEELGVRADPLSVRALGRHVAEAANEPGHTVAADVFEVELTGEPRATAEIDELAWVDPDKPGDIELAPLTRHAVLALLR
ncbi:DNA mismatch repair protein MutT [Mycolicibacterium agri]|uniref:DNA mismatch repair protein MutT n=1 Tax=Mycolicibacterium agri TaxID=36811 RepID=A0A2A7N8A0_MYCAG|nr:NUDIX domain-containing protein [Mycolicibacterium agri]PEG39701.1 DNA mismatch repair protein MutT [Mycolicibacterium agri]GFG52594.1 DNA mismatch repair protein MutT [Mycolicibacterium agri]